MESPIFSLLSLSILLSLNGITLCFGSAPTLDSDADKHALLSFKTSIASDPRAILRTNWSENTSVCNWIGVKCGVKHQRVTALNLSGFDLVGTVSPHLGNLTFLRYLDIRSNNFSSVLPFELSRLRRLKVMIVVTNSLTGEVPKWLSSLSQLEVLALSNNNLSGSIPREIKNMTMLVRLALGFNNLTGEIPREIGSLPSLEVFSVFGNSLSGYIPSSIFNISSLMRLELSYNKLSGTLPSHLGHSLTNLQVLLIGANQLSGHIPNSITNASKLTHLDLAENSFSGSIPDFGNLRLLQGLWIWGNSLTGPIPPTIGKMKNLQRLHLDRNQLVGSIPNNLCRLGNLGAMVLSRNMLVGSIPDCFGEVNKSLRVIDLASNRLSSTIPTNFWTLTDLLALFLFSNSFTGELPSQLGKFKTINALDLSSNQFSGNIPTSIDGCQSLEFLDLSNNHFRGSIPQSLGNVKGLIALDLSHNNLSGSIPKSLEGLRFLQNFSVSDNKLEGHIPDEGRLGNFTAQSFARNFALCGSPRLQVTPCSKNEGGSRGKKVVQLMKYMVPSLIVVVFSVFVALLFMRRRKQQKHVSSLSADIPPVNEWRRISYIEVERGTNCFGEGNLVGRGSFGSVFRALLPDGLEVAVKVFNLQLEGGVKSFDTETNILAGIRHRNLVRIIGCCSNTSFKALVLTYMPNGSLDKWLYSRKYFFDLTQRLKIAIDVAAALEYLHHGYTFPVVHCDVKPSNVLLDLDMIAHLSDFGISKMFEEGEAFIRTQTLATTGYAAPEFGTEGKVSTNGDVYSFGILLLEIFTGKKPTDDMFGGEMNLIDWVSEALQRNETIEIAAANLLSREDRDFSAKERCMSSIFELGMKCTSASAEERINMIEATRTLHKINVII